MENVCDIHNYADDSIGYGNSVEWFQDKVPYANPEIQYLLFMEIHTNLM